MGLSFKATWLANCPRSPDLSDCWCLNQSLPAPPVLRASQHEQGQGSERSWVLLESLVARGLQLPALTPTVCLSPTLPPSAGAC